MNQRPDPYTVAVSGLRARWLSEASPRDVVHWIYAALDEAGDTTVPRTIEARENAVVMVGQVFADIGDSEEGCDYGAIVSNALRAMEREVLSADNKETGKPGTREGDADA